MPAATPSPRYHRPPLPLLLAEAPRAALEFSSLVASWPWLLAAPIGDGHPVLVLPGLLATDLYTAVLRSYLRARGHAVAGWRAGRNWGHWEALETTVLPQVERLYAEHGRKVSVIGASMGGLYARAAAHRLPGMVRNVVTFSSAVQPSAEGTYITPLYEAITRDSAHTLAVAPPGVPSTSVFSRSDGLSDWRPVLQADGPETENVEVVSSHLGMCLHPAVLYVAADRLAQPERGWRPFKPPAWGRLLYPPGPHPAGPMAAAR
jgi:pimeloyl-ACP methyl ester carboxylesterase